MSVFPLTPVPDDLADRDTYEEMIIPLYALFRQMAAKGERHIQNKTFIRCRIDGPAVVLPLGGLTFQNCDMGVKDGDVTPLILKPMSASNVIGVIGMANCRFEDCKLFSIGFTAPHDALDDLAIALGGQGPAQ